MPQKSKLLTRDTADSIINTDTAFRLGTDFAQGAASTVSLNTQQRAVATALEATVNFAMQNLADSNLRSQKEGQVNHSTQREQLTSTSYDTEQASIAEFLKNLF